MLEPATPNEIPNSVQSPSPPVNIEGELEYEIAEIVNSKIDCCLACKLLCLDCPRAGPGRPSAIFAGPGPGP